MNRPVTEQDFRQPQFRDAKPEDYERRADGKIVRKDRWETTVRAIATTIAIEDNAAGEYVVVAQHGNPEPGHGKISIDPAEWPALRDAIDRMIVDCRACDETLGAKP